MPTYNQRLTANNNKIDEITTIARNLPDAGGSSEPNIFVQTTEPSKKKGIWLQTNKTVEHYVSDNSIDNNGRWANADETADIPYQFNNGAVSAIGANIYIFGSGTSDYKRYAYKYDTVNNTYTRLTDIPRYL